MRISALFLTLVCACAGSSSSDQPDAEMAGPALDASSTHDATGPSPGLADSCDATLVADGDANLPNLPLNWHAGTALDDLGILTGSTTILDLETGEGQIIWESMSCGVMHSVAGLRYDFLLAVHALRRPWSEREFPVLGSDQLDTFETQASASLIIVDEAAGVSTHQWECRRIAAAPGSQGSYNWTVTRVEPIESSLENVNSFVYDGEFHGVCIPTSQPLGGQATGSLQIDVTF